MNSHNDERASDSSAVESKPFRVLCIDGGGMRGIYSAAYLDDLQRKFVNKRELGDGCLDIGKAFDLMVGTSTGAIIAMGLAAQVPSNKILELYKTHGKDIFPITLPAGTVKTLVQMPSRPKAIKNGDKALQTALQDVFGDTTLGELYKTRQIAISIPAVDMSTHNAWVFKTAHLPGSNHRDDNYSLVDVCRATSAAPIFRSLAAIDNPDNDGFRVFADGGLYANSPIMIGLIDSLKLAAEDQDIEIYALGTCKPTSGEHIEKQDVHRGLGDWKFGGKAAELSIDAQEEIAWHTARLLLPHLNRKVNLVRFPRKNVTGNTAQYLSLDETRPEAATALQAQAHTDVNGAISMCADPLDTDGQRLNSLMLDMPHMPA